MVSILIKRQRAVWALALTRFDSRLDALIAKSVKARGKHHIAFARVAARASQLRFQQQDGRGVLLRRGSGNGGALRRHLWGASFSQAPLPI